jgi:hypothetical protein
LFADCPCEHGAESIDPEPEAFVTDVDAMFMEQVFDDAKRREKSQVHLDRELVDLRRRLELGHVLIK